MSENTNDLIDKALEGDTLSLEKLIIGIKDKIYNISLRMLWNPSDAEDTTQEILIKVITNLSKFRKESHFSTWVYRIAYNHLCNINKRGLERETLSFEIFEKGIKEGFDTKEFIDTSQLDRNMLEEELKISCTHAMLQCLDREDRMIYILSTMFDINSKEGAQIIRTTPEAYRKKLSRIRKKMQNFLNNNCGLANPEASCRCNRRIEIAIENQRINPKKLIFAEQPSVHENFLKACKDEMEQLDKVSGIFTSNPYYLTPEHIIKAINHIVRSYTGVCK